MVAGRKSVRTGRKFLSYGMLGAAVMAALHIQTASGTVFFWTNKAGTATWSGTGNNNWASTSGGATGIAWSNVTTTPNDATFDANSGTPGTVTLSGTINVHNLTFAVGGWTLSGGTALDGGSTAGNDLTISTTGTNTINSVIGVAGSSNVNIGGGGTLVLGATNTYTGITTVSGGTTLSTSNSRNVGAVGVTTVVLNNGTLLGSASYTLLANRGIALGASDGSFLSGTLDAATGVTMTIAGVIANNGANIDNLIKGSGTGTVVLTGSNTYSGTTTINGGVLQIGAAGTAGTLGGGSVTNNGTLTFNRTDSVTIANNIGGSGNFIQAGTGAVVLGSASNGYSGGTTLSSGELSVSGLTASGSNSQVGTGNITFSGGVLGYTGATDTNFDTNLNGRIANPTTFNGGFDIATAGTSVTINTALTGTNLSKSGAGTLVLSNANTWSGTATLSAGTLKLTNASALSGAALSIAGGVLDYRTDTNNSSITTATTTISGSTTINLDPITSGTGLNVQLGAITNTAATTNTITITSANAYALSVGAISQTPVGATTLTIANAVPLTIASFATSSTSTPKISFQGAGTATITGNITQSGTGALALDRSSTAGLLVLQGSSNMTGLVTITNGTIRTAVTNAFGSTSGISMGAGGILDLRQDSSATFGNGTTAYPITFSASGPTINVDQASSAAPGTTITLGTVTMSNAAVDTLNMTGTTGVSLSLGVVNNTNTTGKNTTLNNTIAAPGLVTMAGLGYSANTTAETIIFQGGGNTIVSTPITQNGANAVAVTVNNSGGTITLTGAAGANSYTGVTTVNAGTLKLAASGATLVSGNLLITAGTGTFDINGNSQTLGLVTNGGIITNSGAGTPTLTIGAGSTGAGSFTGAMNLIWNQGGASTALSGSINNAGTITNSGAGAGTATFSGSIGSNVTQIIENSSTSALSITGAITVNGGLTLTPTLGTFTVNGSLLTVTSGIFDLGGVSPTFTGITGTGTITNNSSTTDSTVTLNIGATNTFDGLLNNGSNGHVIALKVIGNNTLVLTNSNSTYSGGITIVGSSSALSISNAGQLGTGSSITLSGSGSGQTPTLIVTGNVSTNDNIILLNTGGASAANAQVINISGSGTTFTVGGVISSSGSTGAQSLNLPGAGTLVLNSAATYNGPTNLTGGGKLQMGVANALPQTTTVLFSGSGGTFDLVGNSTTVGRIQSATGFTTALVTNSSGTPASLTITGELLGDSATTRWAGTIEDGTGGAVAVHFSNTNGGNVGWLLGTANDYTGGTFADTTGVTIHIAADRSLGRAPVAPNTTIGSLSLANGANLFAENSLTLNANRTITIGSGSADLNLGAASGQTLTIPQSIDVGAHRLVINSGTVVVSHVATTNGTGIYTSGGTVQFSADDALQSGSQLMTSNGTNFGTVDLEGHNLHVTTINGNSNVANGGVLQNSGGLATVTLSATGSGASATLITGPIALVMTNNTAAQTFTLTNTNNSYSGGTTINNGGGGEYGVVDLLPLFANSGLGTQGITFNGGILQITVSGKPDSKDNGRIANPSTFNGGFDISDGGTTFTLNQALSGSGNFTKKGLGQVVLGSSVSLPTGTLTANGGALDLNGNSVSVAGLVGTGIVTNNSSASNSVLTYTGTSTTFGGVLNNGSGGKALGLSVTGGTLTMNNATTASTYSGGTNIAGATLSIVSDGNLGAAPGSATPGNVKLNGGTLTTAATITLSGNRGIALGSVSGNGSGTVNVGTGFTLTYNGIMADAGGTGNGLIKAGAGTLVLGGGNSYTGTTTVQTGALVLTGTGSISSSSKIIVGDTPAHNTALLDVSGVSGGFQLMSGQTLGGHGSITGAVTVNPGADLSPGNSIGTTTYNTSLTESGGSNLDYDFATPLVSHAFVAGSSDLIAIGSLGTLVFTGTVNLNLLTGSGNFTGTGSYELFSYATPGSVSGFTSGDGVTTGTILLGTGWTSVTGLQYSIVDDTTAQGIFLDFSPASVVPEPTSLALLGLGAAGLMARRRRR